MDKDVFVYVDLQGTPHMVGRLWARMRKDRESATFEYDKSWLTHAERFSLEPALKLVPGPFHTRSDKPLFGAIGDSAPDRWGRALMRRAERRRAGREGQNRAPSAKSITCSWWGPYFRGRPFTGSIRLLDRRLSTTYLDIAY